MDKWTFMACFLPGVAVVAAVFFPLGAKRRARIPQLVLWLCLPGIVGCLYGSSHSTTPSLAPRITAVGKAYDHEWRQTEKYTRIDGFRFVPDGGNPIRLETQIKLPDWNPAIFNGRSYRIVYLMAPNRGVNNEAIDILVLSGEHAGFHGSMDADPLGTWLTVPLGAVLFGFGYMGLKYRKADLASAADRDANQNPNR